MPGEFEPHDGCWMLWPERTDNWHFGAKPAQKAFAEVAESISKFEKVTMCVSQNQYRTAREMLSPEIRVIEMSYDDSWMRDVGPTFVVNDSGKSRGIDWRLNAWGGAIHTDEDGTAIVTEACLLDKSRNPDLSKAEIEYFICEYIGVDKVLWLPNGIFLDETNEHVDNIVHYCAPGVIVLAWTDDRTDPQYKFSKSALKYLENETDAKGRKLIIHKLHIPNPVIITKEESEGVDIVEETLPRNAGDRQAASYANFYMATGAVIFPLFGDEIHDKAAYETLSKIFNESE